MEQKQSPETTRAGIYLVLVSEGVAEVHEMADRESLVRELRRVIVEDAEVDQVLIFEGKRHYLTQGKVPYIRFDDGQSEPLVELPPPGEINRDGFIREHEEIDPVYRAAEKRLKQDDWKDLPEDEEIWAPYLKPKD